VSLSLKACGLQRAVHEKIAWEIFTPPLSMREVYFFSMVVGLGL
jgi:hypothetical protein